MLLFQGSPRTYKTTSSPTLSGLIWTWVWDFPVLASLAGGMTRIRAQYQILEISGNLKALNVVRGIKGAGLIKKNSHFKSSQLFTWLWCSENSHVLGTPTPHQHTHTPSPGPASLLESSFSGCSSQGRFSSGPSGILAFHQSSLFHFRVLLLFNIY